MRSLGLAVTLLAVGLFVVPVDGVAQPRVVVPIVIAPASGPAPRVPLAGPGGSAGGASMGAPGRPAGAPSARALSDQASETRVIVRPAIEQELLISIDGAPPGTPNGTVVETPIVIVPGTPVGPHP